MAEQKKKKLKRTRRVGAAALTGYGVRLYVSGRKGKMQAQVKSVRGDINRGKKVVNKVKNRNAPKQQSLFSTNKKGESKKTWKSPTFKTQVKRAPAQAKTGYKWGSAGGIKNPPHSPSALKVGAHIGRHKKAYAAGAGGTAVAGSAVYAYRRRKRKKAANKSPRKGRK